MDFSLNSCALQRNFRDLKRRNSRLNKGAPTEVPSGITVCEYFINGEGSAGCHLPNFIKSEANSHRVISLHISSYLPLLTIRLTTFVKKITLTHGISVLQLIDYLSVLLVVNKTNYQSCNTRPKNSQGRIKENVEDHDMLLTLKFH